MSDLTWEQKARAIAAISPFSFKIVPMHGGNGWCASASADIKSGHILKSGNGLGDTVEIAVEALWQRLVTDLAPDEYVVTSPEGKSRRALRWNGFMWADVSEAAS